MESAIEDIEYFIKQYKNSQFDHDKRKYWLCLHNAIKELEPTSITGIATTNTQPLIHNQKLTNIYSKHRILHMTELFVVTVCGEVETLTQVFSDLVKSNQYFNEMSKIYDVNDYRISWSPVVVDCENTTQILSHAHLEKLKDSEWTSLYNSKINN